MKKILSALAIAALAGATFSAGAARAECGGHTASASVKNMSVAQADTIKDQEAVSTNEEVIEKPLIEEKAE
ncbi:MAG: hypothetical protein R3D32_05750 [Nitratireductor sp.]